MELTKEELDFEKDRIARQYKIDLSQSPVLLDNIVSFVKTNEEMLNDTILKNMDFFIPEQTFWSEDSFFKSPSSKDGSNYNYIKYTLEYVKNNKKFIYAEIMLQKNGRCLSALVYTEPKTAGVKGYILELNEKYESTILKTKTKLLSASYYLEELSAAKQFVNDTIKKHMGLKFPFPIEG